MAPATLESASPIGIANVSLNLFLSVHDFSMLMNCPSFQTSGTLPTSNVNGYTKDADISLRHKIVAKRGAAFTIMVSCCSNHRNQASDAKSTQVAGESGLGKTTFINTLFSTTIKNYADHKRRHAKQVDKTVEIEITKADLEEKFYKGTLYQFNYNAMFV